MNSGRKFLKYGQAGYVQLTLFKHNNGNLLSCKLAICRLPFPTLRDGAEISQPNMKQP